MEEYISFCIFCSHEATLGRRELSNRIWWLDEGKGCNKRHQNHECPRGAERGICAATAVHHAPPPAEPAALWPQCSWVFPISMLASAVKSPNYPNANLSLPSGSALLLLTQSPLSDSCGITPGLFLPFRELLGGSTRAQPKLLQGHCAFTPLVLQPRNLRRKGLQVP